MARVTKKPAVTAEVEEIKTKEANEVESLKNEVSDLKEAMKQLMETLQAKKEAPETVVNNNIQETVRIVEKEPIKEVPLNKLVRIMSTTNGGMTLFTATSNGRQYRFNEFGAIMPMTYADVLGIISTHHRWATDGHFIILDDDAVDSSGLRPYYDKFIDVETIKNILDQDESKIREIFSTATRHLQETILEFVYKRIASNETVDRNKILILNDITGKDIQTNAKIYSSGVIESRI